jgi:hypothetical protein
MAQVAFLPAKLYLLLTACNKEQLPISFSLSMAQPNKGRACFFFDSFADSFVFSFFFLFSPRTLHIFVIFYFSYFFI